MAVIDVTSPAFAGGAKGDVREAVGSIHFSALGTLRVALGTFKSGDVGKFILIVGAGPTTINGVEAFDGPLHTRILSVSSNGAQAVLETRAWRPVGNQTVMWGTDDTAAFRAAAAAVGSGDELRIPGSRIGTRTYMLMFRRDPKQGASENPLAIDGSGVCDFTGLNGVRVTGWGTTLLTSRTLGYKQGFNLFTFQDCTDVEVLGVRVRGHFVTGGLRLVVQNATVVHLYGRCRNVLVDVSGTGVNSLLAARAGSRAGSTANDLTDDAKRSAWIRLRGTAVSSGYAAEFQHSGDDAETALTTDGCYRSLIVYGAKRHRHRIESRNHVGADVLLQAYSGHGVRDMEITYTNRDFTAPYGVGTGTAAVEFDYGDGTPAVHRDVRIRYDVKYLKNQAFGPALRINNASAPLMVGHRLERLRLEGMIEGQGHPFDFNFANHVVSANGAKVFVGMRDLEIDMALVGTLPTTLPPKFGGGGVVSYRDPIGF